MVSGGKTMVVEVWSDFMCPYCYLGTRMLKSALAEFPHRNEVDVVWKSYQLDPAIRTDPGMDVYQFLARKGFDRATVMRAHEELREKGARQGIVFAFENSVVANSFNAHRLMHFARESNNQERTHDALFRAHFTDGRNLDDEATLIAIGVEVGLDAAELARALRSDAYADAVRADVQEARDLGIEAVPHFMFDRNHEVIGAEGSVLLLRTLEVAFREWVDNGGCREGA
jgi:predicted DsbA family dithiol-disulfide isomerase